MMVCPHQPCGVCSELAKLDATKATPQNFLDIIHRRHRLKSKLNSWHDRLVSRLPVEIVSRIFIFLDNVNEPGHAEARCLSTFQRQYWDHLLRTTALLSRVCRRWRDIALGTPQLWTNLIIDVWPLSRKLELLKKILFRSGSLSLNLVLHGNNVDVPEPKTLLQPITQLIRSHSGRWGTLDIDYVPNGMAHMLLHNLDHMPTSDNFNLRTGDLGWKPIALREPLRPRRFGIAERGDNMVRLPLKWDNITHLDLFDVQGSTLLDIIQQMPRLTDWVTDGVTPLSNTNTPLPATPITIPTLERLELTFQHNDAVFFRFLTLPALTHLKCHFGDDFPEDIEELVFANLIDFVARSELNSKSLKTFDLKYAIVGAATHDPAGLLELTAITHLHLDILDTTNGHLRPFLSPMSDITVLPNLRELRIEMAKIFPSAWKTVCDVFQGGHVLVSGNEPHSEAYISRRFHKRPLEHVGVSVYNQRSTPSIQYKEYAILKDIQRTGVKVELKDIRGADILAKMSKIYDFVH